MYKIKISKALYYILFLTPFVYVPFGITYSALPKVLFFSTFSLMLFLIWYIKDKENIFNFDTGDKIMYIYFLLLVLNLFITPDLYASLIGNSSREDGFFTLLIYFLLFFLAKNHFEYKKKYVLIFFVVISFFSLHGIIQYYGYDFLPRAYYQIGWTRAFSTFGNPNFFASYLVLVLPITQYAYLEKAYLKNKFLNGFLIVMGLAYYCLLATLTRGSWIGFFVSVTLMCILFFLKRKKFAIKYLVFMLSFLLLLTLIFDFFSQGAVFGRLLSTVTDASMVIQQKQGFENAGSHRLFIWLKVIELIKMNPWLGVGIETLDIAFQTHFYEDVVSHMGYYIDFDKAHNEFLHIAVTTGIPSLMAYLGFLAFNLHKMIKGYLKSPLLLPLLCSLSGYLVQANFNIQTVFSAYVFWIFLGAGSNLSNINNLHTNKNDV